MLIEASHPLSMRCYLVFILIAVMCCPTEGFTRPVHFKTADIARRSASRLDILPTPFLLAEDSMEEAPFTDQIDILDPTIQTLLGVFGIFILLAVAAKALFDQMDTAIGKVLVDFETTMRRGYSNRWEVIEKQLEGTSEEERPAKLFEIMEKLQREEPALMARINQDIQESKYED